MMSHTRIVAFPSMFLICLPMEVMKLANSLQKILNEKWTEEILDENERLLMQVSSIYTVRGYM